MSNDVLKLSNILISNHDLKNFQELLELVQVFAQRGERFLQFDVKPEFPDTPENWEDRLEAAFSGRV
ncbi:sulfur relay protein DsrC [Thiolapillus sp.]|uniref:Sulfur relay protein DsrC n=1 Tax=Thiolapillus brandeum TaxID=1076588 RepID=A0A831RYY4_9GAMM|nr:sulfur relay protein DsrC [Thiolapillus sp.]HEC07782.1 sulfur relay protein DsrC [Thiolapillus brandeum]